jgi:hypothetical protein
LVSVRRVAQKLKPSTAALTGVEMPPQCATAAAGALYSAMQSMYFAAQSEWQVDAIIGQWSDVRLCIDFL